MKDLFSDQSSNYAQYRPEYPDSLYQLILQHVPEKRFAWDCATGNGQAAKELCHHFKYVFATDISEKQLAHAHEEANINYSQQSAERTDFPDARFDLITVAQALHWLDFEAFFAEVKRVAKPGAILAVWGYEGMEFESKEIRNQFLNFYEYETAKYWEPEREYLRQKYRTIDFPFEHIADYTTTIVLKWHRHEFEGYLNSWSAVQKCIRETEYNPVPSLMFDLEGLWGEFSREYVRFPVFIRVFRV